VVRWLRCSRIVPSELDRPSLGVFTNIHVHPVSFVVVDSRTTADFTEANWVVRNEALITFVITCVCGQITNRREILVHGFSIATLDIIVGTDEVEPFSEFFTTTSP